LLTGTDGEIDDVEAQRTGGSIAGGPVRVRRGDGFAQRHLAIDTDGIAGARHDDGRGDAAIFQRRHAEARSARGTAISFAGRCRTTKQFTQHGILLVMARAERAGPGVAGRKIE
jgi:hypothetical protein